MMVNEGVCRMRAKEGTRPLQSMPPAQRRSGWAAALVTILCWLSAASVPCEGSAPLFSGSLTWRVHPQFASGVRQVEFTLDTAFEMNVSHTAASGCKYTVGEAVSCTDGTARWGRLCVDQYSRTLNLLEALNPYETEGKCPGADNVFVVKETRHINGANIVFGRLQLNVTVQQEAFALIAFLATGRRVADEDASGGAAMSAGTLMPQCNANMSRLASLPCSVNTHHRQYNATLPIEFGLFKTPTQQQAKALRYFGSLKLSHEEKAGSWAAMDGDSGLYRQFPSLETLVALCATMPASTLYKCNATGEELRNYFSPRPVIPGVIEVAVTPFTQSSVTFQNPWGQVRTRSLQGIAEESAPFRYWYFPGYLGTYAAPHPPLHLKAFDLDG